MPFTYEGDDLPWPMVGCLIVLMASIVLIAIGSLEKVTAKGRIDHEAVERACAEVPGRDYAGCKTREYDKLGWRE